MKQNNLLFILKKSVDQLLVANLSEWSKEADSRPAVVQRVGSNPTIRIFYFLF